MTTTDEDREPRHWVALLIPAITFLVGLALGGILVYAGTGGSDDTAGSDEAAASSETSSPRGGGDTVVTLPAACQDAAEQIQDAYTLLQQAVSQVRDFQAGALVETLNDLEDVDSLTRPLVSECSAVSVTTSPSPSETPTAVGSISPSESTTP